MAFALFLRYSRSSRPPAVRAHSRQNRTHDTTPAAERLAM